MTETTNSSPNQICPVNSYNEWDKLEEVIVGRLEGATIPSYHVSVTHNIPKTTAKLYRFFAGRRYPNFLVQRAQKELDEFIHILKSEGIIVRRPEITNFSARYQSPNWKSKGFCSACPRDGFLVIGNEIIETPMSWRSRYFEIYAYRSLFKEYFRQGAKWTSAPKPQLLDSLYDYNFTAPKKDEPIRYVINEFEPVFDAADFVRCGQDIFALKSNVTNSLGITWLQRHLGEKYKIHEIETECRTPMHIDTTFMPLAPGKVLVNPEYINISKLPKILKSWDILIAPEPDPIPGFVVSMCSKWISLNVLMLDEKRVIVEKSQESMIQALKNWGFEPIKCSFLNFAPFGGSFHCATLDIRRKGELQSYF
ncbi:amidinotransferase [Chlorogloeopsis sp. ULAP01]|uniref:amidinotransferase n=1 Tax=Chlorogloeopsis sp. ULAP01 TaxID=3056483 RepID=UPI0025AADAFE|nr:amidinotransferase [Chlorogloeopsis sp. ULAP01]MDM9383701.1 amidinotransferase [Chlorogloeopsis sp. ULAP01]